MIRSLHIHGDLDVAGAQTVIMNYLRGLDGDSDVAMILLINGCPKNSAYEKECIEKGYNVVFSHYTPWSGPKLLRSIVNWFRCQHYLSLEIRKQKPDIIHSHGTICLPYVTLPALFSGAKARFHTLHSDPYAFTKGFALWARFAFNIARTYPVCVTEGQAKKAEKRYHIKRYSVIHNGIDSKRFLNIDRTAVRRELGIRDDSFVIGCVGRFDKIKNHLFLVRLFSEFVKQNPNALLMLVGEGPERKNVEKLATELGVNDKILFTGLRNDVERMYFAMDLFMLTSHFESSSIVTVEAQFAGLRCVVATSIPETVVVTPKVNRVPLNAPLGHWLSAMKGELQPNTMVGALEDFSVRRSVKELKQLYGVLGKEHS